MESINMMTMQHWLALTGRGFLTEAEKWILTIDNCNCKCSRRSDHTSDCSGREPSRLELAQEIRANFLYAIIIVYNFSSPVLLPSHLHVNGVKLFFCWASPKPAYTSTRPIKKTKTRPPPVPWPAAGRRGRGSRLGSEGRGVQQVGEGLLEASAARVAVAGWEARAAAAGGEGGRWGSGILFLILMVWKG